MKSKKNEVTKKKLKAYLCSPTNPIKLKNPVCIVVEGGTMFFPKRKKTTPKQVIIATPCERDLLDRPGDRMKERGPPEDELEDPHAWTIDRELKRQRVRRTVMRP